jgi:hypothetical protein
MTLRPGRTGIALVRDEAVARPEIRVLGQADLLHADVDERHGSVGQRERLLLVVSHGFVVIPSERYS